MFTKLYHTGGFAIEVCDADINKRAEYGPGDAYEEKYIITGDAVDCLNAYESTGLMPAEIEQMKQRLQELEGRRTSQVLLGQTWGMD